MAARAAPMGVAMLPRAAIAVLAVALLAGCDSSPKRMSAQDVERLLEGKNGPNVVCTRGTDGWDYTCKTVHRKIGVDVHGDGTAEFSNWTPVDEPLTVGPGGEGRQSERASRRHRGGGRWMRSSTRRTASASRPRR